jgi:hypothetical protein
MQDDSTREDGTRDETLDRMLAASGPRVTELTPAVEDELARMTVAARTDTAPSRGKSRRAGRVAAVGVAAALLLGGAGAAAAATGGFTSWWADEPAATYEFTLPSGARCEARWGNITAGTKDEPIAEAARRWYATADVDALVAAGIDAQVALVRADDFATMDDEGHVVSTEDTRTDDSVYVRAVSELLYYALTADLERQGFDLEFEEGDWGLRTSGEMNCPGAQW